MSGGRSGVAAVAALSALLALAEATDRDQPVELYDVGKRGGSTESARQDAINELLAEENKIGSGLRVFVQGGGCSGFQYGLMIEESGGSGDQVYESNGIRLFVDPVSISYLKGAEVDFVDTVTGGGFTIKNPNATSTCGCGQSFSA